MNYKPRLSPQGEDLEILGDDWTVGESDLCHRLTTGCSMVGHARSTDGQWERVFSMPGRARESSTEVEGQPDFTRYMTEGNLFWAETPEAI